MESEFEALEEKISLDERPTNEDYAAALKGAIQSRAAITYLIWKTLQEAYPDVDATKVLGDAYRAYGRYYGEKWEHVEDAASALLAQTSKGGYLVFGQTFKASGPEYAQKDFGSCPHMEMFRMLGASDEEMKILCQDILSEGDYGNFDPHEGVSLEFKKQIGAGDDHCEYCVVADCDD